MADKRAGKFGRIVIGEDGKAKTKAAPDLLPEELRKLPGELVTKDVDDPGRVHALDPEHVRESLVFEARESSGEAVWSGESEEPPPPDAKAPESDREARRNNPQLAVDIVRLRILRAWAESEAAVIERGGRADMHFKYVWFPDPGNFDRYAWRDPAKGDPPLPCDSQRPPHLRGLDLVVDLGNPRLIEKIIEHVESSYLPADKRYLGASRRILSPNAALVGAALRGSL